MDSAAARLRRHARQTAPNLPAAREDTGADRHTNGAPPTLSTAAGWEARETPGSRRNHARHRVPASRFYQEQGPQCLRRQRLSKSPGERLPRSRGKQSGQVTRGHSVCPDHRPWSHSASRVAGSGEEQFLRLAVQGRGAKAAAMASHVRR